MNFVVIAVGVFSSKSTTGGDTILIELAKRLLHQGNHVAIVTSRSGEVMFKSQGLDAEFWTITKDERVSEPSLVRAVPTLVFRMFKAGLLLRKKRLSENTVLFATSDLLYELFPILFVSNRRIKRVLSFHQIMPNPFRGYRGAFTNKLKFPNPRETIAYFQHQLSLLCLRYASELIFSLSNLQFYLIGKGIPEKKIVGFSPGINWDVVNNAVVQGKRYDACWMGRYHTMKGYDDLIAIWGLVCKERSEARLAIMGSASRRLEPLIKERHLEKNIEVLGFVDEETKFRTMKESKILLFPSYYESWGMVISEAMACGLPAIVYDLPVYRGIYPQGTIKVPIGNHKAFASEAISLLTDEKARERLSKEAVEVASHWSWDKVADSFLGGVNKVGRTAERAS